MKPIQVTTRNEGRRDRRLETMLGLACLMLATACLVLAGVVGLRSFSSASPSSSPVATAASSGSVNGLPGSESKPKSQVQFNDVQLRAAVVQQLHNATCCDSLRSDKVAVSVQGSVVTLTGSVRSVGERNSAVFLARIVMGVKAVTDEIVVAAVAKTPLPAQPGTQEAGNTVAQKPARAIHRSTPQTDESAELKTWVDLGNSRLNSGDYAGAIRYFNLALSLDPGNKDAIVGLRRARSAQRAEETIVKQSA